MKTNSIPGWMLTITTAVTAILLLLSAPTGLAADAPAKVMAFLNQWSPKK